MTPGIGRLLVDLRTADFERAAEILAACSTIDIEAGEPYFGNSFPTGALLVVEEGFVVLRATPPGYTRSVIACEAGPARLLLQPSPDEVLFGLGAARLSAIPPDAFERVLPVPGAAPILLGHLAAALSQKQEAIGNFAFGRHRDRVRRKLLQLGRNYGRVDREGIRIDFPISHTVLAEMIGSSRETVTRAVDELQRTGFIARQGHTYRLLVSPESVVDSVQP